MKIEFNSRYFLWFIILLAIEIGIALFLKTGFIRHTVGDYLVVILMYCFFRSFWKAEPITVCKIVLIIAFSIEFLQLFDFLEYLNLSNNKTAKIILGSTFHLSDLLAYTFGILTVLFIERKYNSNGTPKNPSL